MTPYAFFDSIMRVQREFDVGRLSLGGVNHWMIIRLLMLGALSREANRKALNVAGQSSHSRIIDNPLGALKPKDALPISYSRRVLGKSSMLFEPPSPAVSSAKMVFYELPADYTQIIDGKAVNRIADGFHEAFGDRVRKVCRFTPNKFEISCRVEPSYVFLAPPPLEIPVEDRAQFMQAVRELCIYLHREIPDFALFPTPVLESVSAVLMQAAAHREWLAEMKPEMVAFQCFVSMEKMAVLVACKQLGIPALEVQHGFCDVNTIFNEMPAPRPGDISLYTDIFWSWGEKTASALKADSGIVANHVGVIAGGDVWGALMAGKAAAERSGFLQRTGADKYTKRVLVGHQIEALVHARDSNSLIPAFVMTAMLQAPKDWLWMVRVHPRSSHLIKPIKIALADAGIVNSEVEITSLEPIEVVLEAVDVYLTGFSVSALEANAIGKPVIVLDDVGKRLFGELIDRGVFGFAESADALCDQIEKIGPPADDFGYYKRDLDYSHRVFDMLLRPRAMDIAS